ncbi:sulfotransferase 1C2-like [Pocillopora damicornis]|uniref:sulfotransferase 1C2-like n=1 Tax=Pocillopora damicornis TaxID=46731 RepID=UPI000F555FA8|nr:sulfotransferase 1C2-like [Pocillopora damicornis]
MRNCLNDILNRNCLLTLAQINQELRKLLPRKPTIHDRAVARTLEGAIVHPLMLLNVNTFANSVVESSFALMKFMEVLMNDLPSRVRLTANFLNKPLSEDIINRIAEQCSFNGMTKDLSRYTVRFNEGQTSILRKGVVGDWKNYFTPELNERFEKEVLSTIEGTGLEFDFEL